ncbi:MAG: D-alanine--D-alanine ligase [Armatimonadota bacterium]|nr:D-alanine--D-alanine ligase [Armatimonadota bacterium]MDR7592664.1 D-alanine--D-alanine ligase [Armatimonadota bacterium]
MNARGRGAHRGRAGRLRVAVLMGGPSPEREISLATGRQILAALDPARYEAVAVEVLRDGRWTLAPGAGDPPQLSPPAAPPESVEAPAGAVPGAGGASADAGGPARSLARRGPLGIDRVMDRGGVDVVILAMHGPYGEDGTVQGLLELLGVPYTGSGVLASALAMDKLRSRQLFGFNDIPVPAYLVAERGHVADLEGLAAQVATVLGYPCVVKPNALGSSIGVSIVRDPGHLRPALEAAWRYDAVALVEEFIAGTEVTCAVLDDPVSGAPQALPLIEIVPRREFFDYEAKYTPGASEEICPARLPPALTARAEEVALRAYRVLGCRDLARVDMFVRGEQVIVLEVNTIPGMTATSLLPQAAQVAGIAFPALLDRLVALALRRRTVPASAGAVP